MTNTFIKDHLKVKIFPSRTEMGAEAAKDAAQCIKKLLGRQHVVNIIFASAPSQNDFLASLAADKSIEWTRINAFHMDEYIGLDKDAPQGFGNFLKDRLFGKVPLKNAHYLNGQSDFPEMETMFYASLLREMPTDIAFLGIGENGHIAFNDPPVADFTDPMLVKVVRLDQMCRRQQINDGCFHSLDEVPTHAFSLTVPALLKAKYIFAVVPTANKADAIYNTVNGEISERCPASILRTKKNAVLYLDSESAKRLNILQT
jgi:glucosamine-6-phosphate deaminase